jgi:hypothetical protein
MRKIDVIIGCKECNDKRHFDIYVTTRFIDTFGKYHNENKIWDTVLKSEVNHQIEMAKKINGLEYSCKCNLCI